MNRRTKEETTAAGRAPWGRSIALAACVTFLLVWAGYRFSVSSAADAAARPHYTIDQLVGTSGTLHNVAYAVAEYPFIPAPAFFQGLAKLRFKESTGHKSYLLGQVRQTGWWYFFPVALAVKSTIPFLILGGIGTFYLGKSIWQPAGSWIAVAPVVAALTLLLVCMPSHINIGVRHILPIYPLLAIIGGVGACRLWSVAKPKYAGPAIVLVLLVWQLTSSIRCSSRLPGLLQRVRWLTSGADSTGQRFGLGSGLAAFVRGFAAETHRPGLDCVRRQREAGPKPIRTASVPCARTQSAGNRLDCDKLVETQGRRARPARRRLCLARSLPTGSSRGTVNSALLCAGDKTLRIAESRSARQ